jgi:hypothetical protein
MSDQSENPRTSGRGVVNPVEDELPDEGAVGLAVAAIAEILPGGTRPKMGEPIHLRKAS